MQAKSAQRRGRTVENAKLRSSLEAVRKTLLDEQFADRLDQRLACWVRASDRGLPLALLERTLRELLDAPFEELAATPGVGHKKMQTMVRLLRRATVDGLHDSVGQADDGLAGAAQRNGHFDANLVCDAEWGRWRRKVQEHGLADEKIGRLAPSLEEVPTVIWHTPLANYVGLNLDEVWRLKNHGEKRVRVVLKVFYLLDEMLNGASESSRHLKLRIVPKFVAALEQWMQRWLQDANGPSVDDVLNDLVRPLLEQTRVDLGSTVAELVAARLGYAGPLKTVQQLARRSSVTRARIYQLFEQCDAMMRVRWPEGGPLLRDLVQELAARRSDDEDDDALALLRLTVELFFPAAESATAAKLAGQRTVVGASG